MKLLEGLQIYKILCYFKIKKEKKKKEKIICSSSGQ